MIRYLKIEENEDYFKIIKIDKVEFKRYSQKVIQLISEELPKVSIEEIWKTHGIKRRKNESAVQTI
jgi:D-mannonate dehydratase